MSEIALPYLVLFYFAWSRFALPCLEYLPYLALPEIIDFPEIAWNCLDWNCLKLPCLELPGIALPRFAFPEKFEIAWKCLA